MTYHQICNQSNTTGAYSAAELLWPFRNTRVHTGIYWIRVDQYLFFSAVFCGPLIVFFF